MTALAGAYLDSIPLVAITGQVDSGLLGRDVFQEIDTTGAVEPFVKHSYLVSRAKDIPRIMKEAFYIASTGRPGPVLVDVPVDKQEELLSFLEAQKDSSNELFEQLLAEQKADKGNLAYLRTNFENLRRNALEIDDRIDKFAIGRSTKRMPKADLAILRVAVSEMLYYDTPDSVVINEAVEMAKKYCSAESAGFINGVLGSIQRNL